MSRPRKITKARWQALGGFRNSNLFRVMRNGRWHYYEGATE